MDWPPTMLIENPTNPVQLGDRSSLAARVRALRERSVAEGRLWSEPVHYTTYGPKSDYHALNMTIPKLIRPRRDQPDVYELWYVDPTDMRMRRQPLTRDGYYKGKPTLVQGTEQNLNTTSYRTLVNASRPASSKRRRTTI